MDDEECATAYVEHTHGNTQLAIGMYFDGVHVPVRASRGSGSSRNNLLLSSPARGASIAGATSRDHRSIDAFLSDLDGLSLPTSARFMAFLQDMVSQRLSESSLAKEAQEDSSKTTKKVIGSGPLKGLEVADCYRCIGYFLGKSILERQTIPAYLANYILSHLVGAPVGINDLKQVDPGMFRVFFEQVISPDGSAEAFDFEDAGLDFSVAEVDPTAEGGIRHIELKPGGQDIAVTDHNKFVSTLHASLSSAPTGPRLARRSDHRHDLLTVFVWRFLLGTNTLL